MDTRVARSTLNGGVGLWLLCAIVVASILVSNAPFFQERLFQNTMLSDRMETEPADFPASENALWEGHVSQASIYDEKPSTVDDDPASDKTEEKKIDTPTSLPPTTPKSSSASFTEAVHVEASTKPHNHLATTTGDKFSAIKSSAALNKTEDDAVQQSSAPPLTTQEGSIADLADPASTQTLNQSWNDMQTSSISENGGAEILALTNDNTNANTTDASNTATEETKPNNDSATATDDSHHGERIPMVLPSVSNATAELVEPDANSGVENDDSLRSMIAANGTATPLAHSISKESTNTEVEEELALDTELAVAEKEETRNDSAAPSLTPAYECLQKTFPQVKLEYPDDAMRHTLEIHEAMKPWLHDKPHRAAGYGGPWIENIWIERYNLTTLASGKNGTLKDHFGPYIPLLIPWTDRWVQNGHRYPAGMVAAFLKALRPNVPYITVSQNADGIMGRCGEGINHADIPNVLVLSAGGYGHVPIPLIKQEEKPLIDVVSGGASKYLVSFLGSASTAPEKMRKRMCDIVSATDMEFKAILCQKRVDWKPILANSRASLCPRGFGRTSYRLAETIHMGLLPVYVYDDLPWAPYEELLFRDVGWMTNLDGLPSVLREIHDMAGEEIDARREKVLEIRDSHYVMPRVMEQISLFMRGTEGDPDHSGGDLKCSKLPECPRSNVAGCPAECRWSVPRKP